MMTVLPTPGAAEDADLAALAERGDQVDDLDARLELLGRDGLVDQGRRGAMDRVVRLAAHDLAFAVDRLAEHVEEPAQRRRADRARVIGAPVSRTSTPRRRPSVGPMATARTTLLPRCCWTSRTSLPPPCSTPLHRRGCRRVGPPPPVLTVAAQVDLEGVVDLGQVLGRELHVDHRADDLRRCGRSPRRQRGAGAGSGGECHGLAPGQVLSRLASEAAIASAAEAISVTSRVMLAWRTLL